MVDFFATKKGDPKRVALDVVVGGFEPPQTEPKPVVLPLHHRTIMAAKVMIFCFAAKFLRIISL